MGTDHLGTRPPTDPDSLTRQIQAMVLAVDVQSDAELLAAWREGRATAGEELVRRYAPAIIRFFRNKVSTPVEDLVQDTFLALVRGQARIEAPEKLAHYLFGIAHNVLREYLRQRTRQPEFDERVSSVAQSDPGPSSILARRREHRLLLAALRRIPLQHQIALELYYWEGFDTTEIGAIIGLSASATRSRMLRARELLERELAAISGSAAKLDSTVHGLDRWVTEIRELLRGE